MTPRLSIERLHVTIGGRSVLDVEELHLEAGELAVVLGDAGSGKTALAATLAGMLTAEGTVRVDGLALRGPGSRRRRQGLAASVRDGYRISGCSVIEALRLAAPRSRRPEAVLERLPQLATRRHLGAQLLSGGEQQLLQLACACCARPRVLVLDSPTVGLAADAAATITTLAREEAAAGCAVLWLEQDQRAAPSEAAWLLIRGRVAPASAAESSQDRS
jgi:branched-chain amino acid transport system ATP-binding protein